MTVLSTITRVRSAAGGQLTAECRRCGLHLDQLPDADVQRALSAFDDAHASGAAVHGRTPPWGWRATGPARPS